jgi:hypothetical protein
VHSGRSRPFPLHSNAILKQCFQVIVTAGSCEGSSAELSDREPNMGTALFIAVAKSFAAVTV